MGTVEKAQAILNTAFSNADGGPLAYNQAYHPAIRQQVVEFIEVSVFERIGSHVNV